jgi:hypothetical protein
VSRKNIIKPANRVNNIMVFFGKVARTSLKRIRANPKQELKERILLGIRKINYAPAVHRWKKFDFAHTYQCERFTETLY